MYINKSAPRPTPINPASKPNKSGNTTATMADMTKVERPNRVNALPKLFLLDWNRYPRAINPNPRMY